MSGQKLTEAREQAQAALDKVMNCRFSNFDAGAVIHWAERGMYQLKMAAPENHVLGINWRAHCGALLAVLEYICEATGEQPDAEDAELVKQIEHDWAASQTKQLAGGAGFEPALPFGRTEYQSAAFNHSATPLNGPHVGPVEEVVKATSSANHSVAPDLRTFAVEIVDCIRGYTFEFSSHSSAHAADYDLVEEKLRAVIAATGEGQ